METTNIININKPCSNKLETMVKKNYQKTLLFGEYKCINSYPVKSLKDSKFLGKINFISSIMDIIVINQ